MDQPADYSAKLKKLIARNRLFQLAATAAIGATAVLLIGQLFCVSPARAALFTALALAAATAAAILIVVQTAMVTSPLHARANQAVDELAKFYLAVVNSSEHIIITDGDGIVLFANQAAENITGYQVAEMIGKKAGSRELWGGQMNDNFYRRLWDIIKNQRRVFRGTITNRRKDGVHYTAVCGITPIVDDRGQVRYFVAHERDITRELNIDRAKTEFVSLASHQLRTPLTAIDWYIEMLLGGEAGRLTKKQASYLREIRTGNHRLIELVSDLLNVSRLEMGIFPVELKPLDIIKTTDALLKDFVRPIVDKRVKVVKHYDRQLPAISADPKFTRIIIHNLLSNAFKYTRPNGQVAISLTLVKSGQSVRQQRLDRPQVLIEVADTGIGIPAHQQNRVFTKLFRADNTQEVNVGGTGFGLYIVKYIVTNLGGDIWFESTENKGSKFSVLLPVRGLIKNIILDK